MIWAYAWALLIVAVFGAAAFWSWRRAIAARRRLEDARRAEAEERVEVLIDWLGRFLETAKRVRGSVGGWEHEGSAVSLLVVDLILSRDVLALERVKRSVTWATDFGTTMQVGPDAFGYLCSLRLAVNVAYDRLTASELRAGDRPCDHPADLECELCAGRR